MHASRESNGGRTFARSIDGTLQYAATVFEELRPETPINF